MGMRRWADLWLALGRRSPRAGAAGGSAARPDPPRRLRLLLIDDEDVVREMVSELLAQEGVDVLCAQDGLDGLRLFERESPEIDVVLLDLSMPGIGGEETYRRLRRIDPKVVVILSSGHDQEEAMRRFGADGPVGFIQKPYRPRQLLAEIGRCLGRAASG